jgi:DUF2892 family protein
MCNDKVIRRFAGIFVILSVAAGSFISPLWFLFTLFVGANLLQSSFTNYCPLERLLGWAGLAGCTPRWTDAASEPRTRRGDGEQGHQGGSRSISTGARI